MKKNWGSILLLIFVFLMLFVPSFKALVIKGFLATGLFNTEIKAPSAKETNALTATDWHTTFTNQSGSSVSLNSLKGKVIFINFWATWCPPCLAEMPNLNDLYHSFKNNSNIVFLTVEMDANKEGATQLFTKKGWTLPLYYPQSAISQQLYTGTLPTTVIIDTSGAIVYKKEGFAQYNNPEFIQQLQSLIP